MNQLTKDSNLSLFDLSVSLNKSNVPVLVGQFFETVAEYLLFNKAEKLTVPVQPDYRIAGGYVEVKATSDSVIIHKEQLDRTVDIQNELFEFVNYFIFYYVKERACVSAGTSRVLFDELSRNIECCCILPADVIYEKCSGAKLWGDRGFYRLPQSRVLCGLKKVHNAVLNIFDLTTNRFPVYAIPGRKVPKLATNRLYKSR